jgi:hypothetical protein
MQEMNSRGLRNTPGTYFVGHSYYVGKYKRKSDFIVGANLHQTRKAMLKGPDRPFSPPKKGTLLGGHVAKLASLESQASTSSFRPL